MIIKRLADGFRNQDWFVVVVEIMIVFIGIFIGLQVDDWNEKRLQQGDEAKVLERLLKEAEIAIGYTERVTKRESARTNNMEATLNVIVGKSPIPEDKAQIELGLVQTSLYLPMTPLRAAYDQLTASGKIQLIRSEEIRRAIALYFGYLNFYNLKLDHFREKAPDVLQVADPFITVVYDSDSDMGYYLSADWAALKKSPEVINAMGLVLAGNVDVRRYQNDFIGQAKRVCDLIARELNTTCNSTNAAEE